jgi:hypothetical protein
MTAGKPHLRINSDSSKRRRRGRVDPASVPRGFRRASRRGAAFDPPDHPFRTPFYRGFIDLVAGQISVSIANAQAYEKERRRAEALAELDRARGLVAKDLPAVALTAFARSEDRRRAMLAGFQVHVSRPVDPDELTAVVASLMGRTGQV